MLPVAVQIFEIRRHVRDGIRIVLGSELANALLPPALELLERFLRAHRIKIVESGSAQRYPSPSAARFSML
jgi:hypothetical protein